MLLHIKLIDINMLSYTNILLCVQLIFYFRFVLCVFFSSYSCLVIRWRSIGNACVFMIILAYCTHTKIFRKEEILAVRRSRAYIYIYIMYALCIYRTQQWCWKRSHFHLSAFVRANAVAFYVVIIAKFNLFVGQWCWFVLLLLFLLLLVRLRICRVLKINSYGYF